MINLSKGRIAAIIIFLVVVIDQLLKIWVKTHFYLGENLTILPWFHLLFIENNGMAFGLELVSKLLLTLFRIVAVAILIWYIVKVWRYALIPKGYVVCLALVTAGAAGNIFDCLFYGLIFNNPYPPEVAVMFPPEGGYAAFMHGRVVDMLYFPLVSWIWPQWMPWCGGKEFLFFQPVFNIADAAISVGVVILVLFYRRYIQTPSEIKAEQQRIDSLAEDK